ncbi:Gnk2-homologous domain-containing protein [Dioscorea alata]|uniref:Gnk2-homologous domain-containing protein n=1 Tax=Dioscorea alata TaxID=55571 RepID=A0ACB7UNX5_DIOAL|nr:Gnk2-homologous domain-containing protein [Dioscorea alata]
MALKSKPLHLFLAHKLLLLFVTTNTYAQNDPLLIYCPHGTNYTNTSPFKANLDPLLSDLVSSVPKSPSLFSNSSFGTAYGLAQCRPDNSPSACANCLTHSATAFSILCPFGRSAALRFDLCLLRYSDTAFFSSLDVTSFKVLSSASHPTVSNAELQDLIYETRSKTSTTESKFGATMKNLSHSRVASATADCTRDLSDDDCMICLNQAVGILLSDGDSSPLARQVVGLSCAVAYVVSSSPVATGVSDSAGNKGNKSSS